MDNDSFNLFTLPFTIIAVLIAFKVLLRFYLYVVYKRITVPFVNKFNVDNNTVFDIASKYFVDCKIDKIKFNDSEKPLSLFKNFNLKTKTFSINNLYHNIMKTDLLQLNFDYVLSRCWLAQKMIKNKSEYNWIKLTYYFFPIINAVIFWLSLVLLITFNFACFYSEKFRNNNFIFKLNHFNILLSILITSGCVSIAYVFVERIIKLKLENDYEKAVKPFVIANFSQYYNDWVTSRLYSRSIMFANFYLKGILINKKQQYKYLGVFVKV